MCDFHVVCSLISYYHTCNDSKATKVVCLVHKSEARNEVVGIDTKVVWYISSLNRRPKHAHHQDGSWRPAPSPKCLSFHGSRRHRGQQAADDEPAAAAGRYDAQSTAFSSAAGHYTAATAAGETLLHAAVVNNCQDYPIFLPGKFIGRQSCLT